MLWVNVSVQLLMAEDAIFSYQGNVQSLRLLPLGAGDVLSTLNSQLSIIQISRIIIQPAKISKAIYHFYKVI
jgi:hypothetical protein